MLLAASGNFKTNPIANGLEVIAENIVHMQK